jgi:hypothetical protein
MQEAVVLKRNAVLLTPKAICAHLQVVQHMSWVGYSCQDNIAPLAYTFIMEPFHCITDSKIIKH